MLQAAREASIETYALYTSSDDSHTLCASHALFLKHPSRYLDIDYLIALVKRHSIDAVHPGYGFLSESAVFSRRTWIEAQAVVIGPGWDVLAKTGDKLSARKLAEECHVPSLPSTNAPTANVQDIRKFAKIFGYPVILKAVDGGGGRGIRLVEHDEELERAAPRANEESPSKQVFVEKAAVRGYRHVEVQIVGDGSGAVDHVWERECSIQRRYQKIVERAPSTFVNRDIIAKVIAAALRMAQHVKYSSLGTFEFLAHPETEEFYFLEINPRLQVEHTITESIASIDLVKIQLDIAQGASLASSGMRLRSDSRQTPPLTSLQLRITAENVDSDWSLSIGKISSFNLPSGNGIRVDTHLVHSLNNVVTIDFDSLIAKIIITATTWAEVLAKARRALEDTRIEGVVTNLPILRAIIASQDVESGQCDTTWLETNLVSLLERGKHLSAAIEPKILRHQPSQTSSGPSMSSMPASSSVLLRKGDAWSMKLTPTSSSHDSPDQAVNHLKLHRVLRNNLPDSLSAEITYSTPDDPDPRPLLLEANATRTSSAALVNQGAHRRGDPNNPRHVVIPFSGMLVELFVDVGDVLEKEQTVCVVRQMKMELEIRAKRGGKVTWVTDAEENEEISEGTLAVELEEMGGPDSSEPSKPKL